jgi:hypothetical protein
MKTENSINYYFVVEAKCGHVGRDRYIPVCFPVRARNASVAAYHVRKKPGVKHHHSDAILSVREVDYIEFVLFQLVFRYDLYWKRVNKYGAALDDRVREETPHHLIYKPSANTEVPLKTNKISTRQFRVRRNSFIEKSICREIEKEYGMIV